MLHLQPLMKPVQVNVLVSKQMDQTKNRQKREKDQEKDTAYMDQNFINSYEEAAEPKNTKAE